MLPRCSCSLLGLGGILAILSGNPGPASAAPRASKAPRRAAPARPAPATSEKAAAARAAALLQRATTKAQQAKTLTATVRSVSFLTGPAPGLKADLRLMKPALGRLTVISDTTTPANGDEKPAEGAAPGAELIATGKEMIFVDPREKKYQRGSVAEGVVGIVENSPLMALAGPAVALFFHPPALSKLMEGEKYLYAGQVTRSGRRFDLIRSTKPGPPKASATLYFGPEGWLEGAEVRLAEMPPMSWWLEKLQVDGPLTAEQFEFVPPAGFTAGAPIPKAGEAALLAVGKLAPELELPDLDGKMHSLAAARKGKKALLVTFWHVNSGISREELPRLQKLREEFGDRGLGLLTIDPEDDAKSVRDYLGPQKLSLPVLLATGPESPATALYGVLAYPTHYLIGADGVILWRAVELNDTALREVLEKVGIK